MTAKLIARKFFYAGWTVIMVQVIWVAYSTKLLDKSYYFFRL